MNEFQEAIDALAELGDEYTVSEYQFDPGGCDLTKPINPLTEDDMKSSYIIGQAMAGM